MNGSIALGWILGTILFILLGWQGFAVLFLIFAALTSLLTLIVPFRE